jgi:hypothetical protein
MGSPRGILIEKIGWALVSFSFSSVFLWLQIQSTLHQFREPCVTPFLLVENGALTGDSNAFSCALC